MSDTTLKAVEEAIWDHVVLAESDSYEIAALAIAAATPHIRAALFDELIAHAETPRFIGFQLGEPTMETFPPVAEWLRKRKSEETSQP